MSNHNTDMSLRRAARIAGFMFLFAFIVPTLNWALVLSKFNVANDALATANNIMTQEFLFRMGLTIELIMPLGLIVLALALFIILKTVNKSLTLFALLLKVVEATLAAVIVLVSFAALQSINREVYPAAFSLEQLQFPAGLILNSHTALFSIPMVFLGLDMMVFTYLFLKSKFIPGVLAGFGILSFALIFIHALMFILAPEYAAMPVNQIIFWAPSGLFEIVIGIWLLVKGVNVAQIEDHIEVGK